MGILLIFVSKSIKESNTRDVGNVESSVIVGGDVHAGYSPNNRARGFPAEVGAEETVFSNGNLTMRLLREAGCLNLFQDLLWLPQVVAAVAPAVAYEPAGSAVVEPPVGWSRFQGLDGIR